MARLTLRVPESLHARLSARAKSEGVSVNQYVVFALSRVTAADEIADQRAGFDALVSRFPMDDAEVALHRVLAARRAT
jgi:hypothetical protein